MTSTTFQGRTTLAGRSRLRKRPQDEPPYLLLSLSLCIVITFLSCTLYLFMHLPDGKRHPISFDDEYSPCPSYGCPVYPAEMETNEDLRHMLSDRLDPRKLVSLSRFAMQSSSLAGTVTITHKGDSHVVNQDRAVIIRPFVTHQSRQRQPAVGEENHENENESFLLAILDGHGVEGHEVAEYAHKELPRLLATKLNDRPCCQSDDWIRQQLNETFVEVNSRAPPDALRGGCTASVTLRIGSKLYFANAGDSQTILVTVPKPQSSKNATITATGRSLQMAAAEKNNNNNNNLNNNDSNNNLNASIVYATRRDKPHLPDERARIEQLGGQIHIPPQNPALARVIVYSEAADPPEPIGLAMSRSIGDWEWKLIGVTAEPIVDVIDLSQYAGLTCFIIAASDGLWDLRRKEFFANRFAPSILQQQQQQSSGGSRNPPMTLMQTIASTIRLISPTSGYQDDITVIVAPIF